VKGCFLGQQKSLPQLLEHCGFLRCFLRQEVLRFAEASSIKGKLLQKTWGCLAPWRPNKNVAPVTSKPLKTPRSNKVERRDAECLDSFDKSMIAT
jgi:hypothetical protein